MIRTLLATLLILSAALGSVSASFAPDEIGDLVEEVRKKREDVDSQVLRDLAKFKNKEALEGLFGLYDTAGSIYLRLEILKTFQMFDGVGECEQQAVQKLMDIATASEERELRDGALKEIADCSHLGKSFLEMIVESGAEDDIREEAMSLHVAMREDTDTAWYKKIFEREKKTAASKKKDKKKKKKGDDAEPQRRIFKLASLRGQAFGAMAGDLTDKEVEAGLSDPYWAVRYVALEEYHKRDAKKALVHAEDIYGNLEGRVELRGLAAQLMADDQGKKIAADFLEAGRKFITPTALRNVLADILAGFGEETVDKQVARLIGKGKPYEKLFIMRAARNIEDEKLNKKFQKLLADKDNDVRSYAAQILAERGDMTALKPLQKMIDKSKDPLAIAEGLDAMSSLRADDPEWDAKLVEYTANEDTEIRNAAIMQIGKDKREAHFDILEEALKSSIWSTRFAALRGMGASRDKSVLGPIVAQMQHETGRMRAEFADVLFELTGKPYRVASRSWEAWWKNEGAGFEVISVTDMEKARAKEEERRLKQVTGVKFFGIRIISHRVIFIIDVSGSMIEEMRSRYEGESATTRMEVAKRELARCIDGLEREALFNIITFSSGVETWLEDGITGANEKSRDEAKDYVARLGAGGATNLYDSIQLAFEDPEVDTIFILSDGEPTAGEETDIGVIRRHVTKWNEHRGIEINTIGVGGDLQVLEWLAEDSGGTHVKFR